MQYPKAELEFPEYLNKDNETLRIEYLDTLLYMGKDGCKDTDIQPWRTLRDELETRRDWRRIQERLLTHPL